MLGSNIRRVKFNVYKIIIKFDEKGIVHIIMGALA